MAYEFSGKIEYEDFLKFNRAHLKHIFLGGKKPLLLTFLAGPFGLLVWLVIRERRARATGRWS